jgi:hypothetical protein
MILSLLRFQTFGQNITIALIRNKMQREQTYYHSMGNVPVFSLQMPPAVDIFFERIG